jgi:hypothetical protein
MLSFNQFITEDVTKEKHHVIIYNRGAGGQALWPQTDKPKALSHGRAIKKVVEHENGSMHRITPTAAHIKPLSVAHHYVTGPALNSVKLLQQHHDVEPRSDLTMDEKSKLFAKDQKAKKKVV